MDIKFETKNRIALTYVNGAKGTLSEADVGYLLDHIKLLGENSKYVETGSYLGCSALLAALNSPATVWAHDIWIEDWSTLDGTVPPPEEQDYFFKFYENILNNKMENRIIPIRGNSAYTLKIHKPNSIDLAFIDGDHSYEGCMADLELLYPCMKPGSFILLHDCYFDMPPYKAVNDFVNKYGLMYEMTWDSSGLFRIPIPMNRVPNDSPH